ncbi:MAG: hypothetical protein KGZ74_03490 [Chitinophagaceae bacterium]|nr:hypothetical protein [Chitinophagaceae bacterium]
MRYILHLLTLTLFSCNEQQQKSSETNTDTLTAVQSKILTANEPHSKNEICWTGTLNSKTPVFIHYQLDSNLIIGEITYLNTKNRIPIRLLGTIENDKSYRLLEFDESGNITGIIEGKPTEQSFKGIWVSPKSKKELSLSLTAKDSVITSPSIKPDQNQVFGEYHYQYGENGFNGDFKIDKVADGKIEFNIFSLTNVERGPNIAEVEKDTIPMNGNSFVYKIPESDDCEFKVTFYKGFVYINYTKGYCAGQFGLNATIDGIYLKIK